MSFISFLIVTVFNTSIYTHSFQDIDGNTQSMSQYQGKKILLVNIATGSAGVTQLAGLQQLHTQYGDSLVIIAFPSNSFGKESRSNAEIKTFCQANYGVSFILAAKTDVTGQQIHPIYNWLLNVSENGIIGTPVERNYQKFLINESGTLVGFYAPTIEPMSSQITDALTNQ